MENSNFDGCGYVSAAEQDFDSACKTRGREESIIVEGTLQSDSV